MVSYLQLLSLCKLRIAKIRKKSASKDFAWQEAMINLCSNTHHERGLKAVEMVTLVAVVAEQHIFTITLAPANSATCVEGRL